MRATGEPSTPTMSVMGSRTSSACDPSAGVAPPEREPSSDGSPAARRGGWLDFATAMRIGMLTGGGDCPGLNPVIRAVCRRLWENGHETFGVLNGWRGMIDGATRRRSASTEISGILPRGGTIIGTSRTNPYKIEGGVEGLQRTFEQLDALVALGGEDTLGVAAKLYRSTGLPVVGVPKTMDNDLNGDRLHLRLRHRRPRRDRGSPRATRPADRTTGSSSSSRWAATPAGSPCTRYRRRRRLHPLPERPVDNDEVRRPSSGAGRREELLGDRRQRGLRTPGRADEGEVDEFGHVRVENRGVGDTVAEEVEARTACRRAPRCSAISSAAAPRPRATGCSGSASGSRPRTSSSTGSSARWRRCTATVLSVPLSEATAELELVPESWYEVAKHLLAESPAASGRRRGRARRPGGASGRL